MEKHWFTLCPDTFLWMKGNNGLIYNTINHLLFFFKNTGRVEKLCHELLVLENLYSIYISEEDAMDEIVSQWIKSVVDIKGGFLTSYNGNREKPVSLMPVFKLQCGIEYYKWNHLHNIGGEIIYNLHQLTFYINGSKYGSNTYYRQTIFPLQKCGQLDVNRVLKFVRFSQNPYLTNINLVGNIFLHPNSHELMDGLAELSIPCTIYITLQDFREHINEIHDTNWPEHAQFHILVDLSSGELTPLQNIQTQTRVSALVFSESNFLSFIKIFDNNPVYCNACMIPIYDGKNIEFFKSNVFTTREELDNIALSKREIFIRQVLNIHNFGNLTIMPDGQVYANINHEPLGVIDESIYSVVYQEIMEGCSWLQIRNQAPCIDCIFQWLCPSPSNYETVIGCPNLCHVKL